MKPLPNMIDIRSLKEFVRESLPRDSIFRQVILIDDDFIPREEMIGRVPIWFKLKKADRTLK